MGHKWVKALTVFWVRYSNGHPCEGIGGKKTGTWSLKTLNGHGNTQTAHRHIGPASGISGLSYGVHQLAADAKVTKLYVTVSVQENVGGFDVWEDMNEHKKMTWAINLRMELLAFLFINISLERNKSHLPLWIIFKFSFKWFSAFTVCRQQTKENEYANAVTLWQYYISLNTSKQVDQPVDTYC